jgi:threonine aldolase
VIDLRSDTVTKPTDEMRQAMSQAEVGDDVYGEDLTVNRLEALGAAMVGKEGALFVASGTMGNLVSLLAHTHPGEEIILGAQAHIYYYEVGGLARIAGCLPRLADDHNGSLEASAVQALLREDNVHFPRTSLVCMENTHNRGGGTVAPPDKMREVYRLAKEHGLAVHLDGARIFNAAVASGRSVTDFTQYTDSLMFCLSKGLCAPVGSLVAGSRDFIQRARRARKLVGGGMRQAGVLAAAGIVALETMLERLAEDHTNARYLASELASVPGIGIDPVSVQSNMVVFNINKSGMNEEDFLAHLQSDGVLGSSPGPQRIRLVMHYPLTKTDMETTLQAIRKVMR